MKRLTDNFKVVREILLDLVYLCVEFASQLKMKLRVARLRRIGVAMRKELSGYKRIIREKRYIDLTGGEVEPVIDLDEIMASEETKKQRN